MAKRDIKDSLVQSVEECFVCRRKVGLHCHHIYFGVKGREKSDKMGAWCYLCYEHHEGTLGVHGKNGHDLDLFLKQQAQKAFEKDHTREEFMEIIGKNYL